MIKQLGEFMQSRTGSINPSKYPNEDFEYYSIPAYDKGFPEISKGSSIGSSKKVFEPGDILLSRIVPHIRRCWIVPENDNLKQIGSGEWIVFRTKEIAPSYLKHYLTSDEFNAKFMKTIKGVGGSLMRADPNQVKQFKIPLPPLDQQKKIAAILDAADAYRLKTKALIDKYDQLSQSLFLEMFGDPVVNSKSWELVKFRDVGTLDRGKSKHRPRNAPELLGGAHPLIQTGDLSNCGIFLNTYSTTYSDLGLAQSRKWSKGTLCITIAANIAKTGILTFDACFPDSVVGFKPNERTNNIYTIFWLSFLQKNLEENAPAAAQKNINLSILRDLDFPLPEISLQNQFADRILEIEKQKNKVLKSELKADELFNSLLQKAFKGELTT